MKHTKIFETTLDTYVRADVEFITPKEFRSISGGRKPYRVYEDIGFLSKNVCATFKLIEYRDRKIPCFSIKAWRFESPIELKEEEIKSVTNQFSVGLANDIHVNLLLQVEREEVMRFIENIYTIETKQNKTK